MTYFDIQLKPCDSSDLDYKIQNIDELLMQLDSLKNEALLMINTRMKDIEVFYKDYNALKIAIEIIKEYRNNGKKNRNSR